MNLIFLDFDGVLNDTEFLLQTSFLSRNWAFLEFDPRRVNTLAQLCHITNAELVLSSSWNMRDGVKEYFESMGFTVVGRLGNYNHRGKAIADWLKTHPKYVGAKYVILDDEKSEYNADQLKHLVFTGAECETQSIKDRRENAIHGKFYPVGLSPRHVGQFLGILEASC